MRGLFWKAARGTGFYGDLKRQQAAFDVEKQEAERAKVAALIEKAGRIAKEGKVLMKIVK